MSALNDFDFICPKVLDAVKLKIANFKGIDHRREPRILIINLQNKTLTCCVQVFYASDRSVDTLKTDILDSVRTVLREYGAFSNIQLTLPVQAAT
jgi:hypothetical protein